MRRIEWTCGCGQRMNADVHDDHRGGPDKLQTQLSSDAANAAFTAASTAQTSTSTVQTSTSTAQTSASTAQTSTSIAQTSNGGLDNSTSDPQNSTYNPRASTATARSHDQRWLLLCLYNDQRYVLIHVDVTFVRHDQQLFEKIRQAYNENRHQSMSEAMSKLCKKFPCLARIYNALNLRQIHAAHIMRFKLVPVRLEFWPRKWKCPSFPPIAEFNQTYLWDPIADNEGNDKKCENICMSSTLTHSIIHPGPHQDQFWLKRFPKKLGEQLVFDWEYSKRDTNGWGVQITESVNKSVLVWVCCALILVGVLFSIIWGIATKSGLGGLAFGSFLVSVGGLLIAMVNIETS